MRRVMYRKEEINTVVVPFVFQDFLLNIFHNNRAHFGARKMLSRLSSRFYWLDMAQDCQRWIAACMECRSRKSAQDHLAGLPGVVPKGSATR
jgi:predicted HD phosphohydrolase